MIFEESIIQKTSLFYFTLILLMQTNIMQLFSHSLLDSSILNIHITEDDLERKSNLSLLVDIMACRLHIMYEQNEPDE